MNIKQRYVLHLYLTEYVWFTKFDNNTQINLISVYAPTLETTNQSPELTEKFYNDLDSVIKLTNSRDTLIIGGDFNAKIKPNNNIIYETYCTNIGKFSKGYINDNGQHLLEFAKQPNLRLTNTFFKHKPCHVTTWECPRRINKHTDSRSGMIRRNPHRNQTKPDLISEQGYFGDLRKTTFLTCG